MLTLNCLQITNMVVWFYRQDNMTLLTGQLKDVKEESVQVHEMYCQKEDELSQLWVNREEEKTIMLKRLFNSELVFAKQGVRLPCTRKYMRMLCRCIRLLIIVMIIRMSNEDNLSLTCVFSFYE